MDSFSVLAVDVSELKPEHLEMVDGIVMHYSVRLAFPFTIPKKQLHLLLDCNLPKFHFIQDEYDNTEVTRSLLEQMKAKIVFTCVPQSRIETIYPSSRFPETKFINVLTGFIPNFDRDVMENDSFESRSIDIGYRGRRIGNRYGKLGFDKWHIGEGLSAKLQGREDVVVDISSNEEDRLYGDEWFKFLINCKSVLATESGSNVFDDLGVLSNLDRANPRMTYQEFEANFLLGKEVDFMGQISPRVFEAITTRTLLILFPGEYSGVLKKDVHYLELARDFTNIENLLPLINDKVFWREMTDNAYLDIALNLKYTAVGYFNMIERELVEFFSKTPLQSLRKQDNEYFKVIRAYENSKVVASDSKIVVSELPNKLKNPYRSRVLEATSRVVWVKLLWRKIPREFRYRLYTVLSRRVP